MNTQNVGKIVVIVIVALLLVGAGYYLISSGTEKKPDKDAAQETQDSMPSAALEFDEGFEEDIKTKTYEEIKKENPAVNNPNISSKDVKDKLEETGIVNAEPVNHSVIFTGSEFVPAQIQIKQGDAVTFKNNGTTDLTIIGSSSWGNKIPIANGKAFTQGFDYKGTYNYAAGGEGNITGVIVVE